MSGNPGASSLTAGFTAANADFVIAFNQSDRDVSAVLTEVDLTQTDSSADLRVESLKTGAMDASVNITTSSTGISLGGVIAENRVGYSAGHVDVLGQLGNLIGSIFYLPSTSPATADTSASVTGGTISIGTSAEFSVTATDESESNSTVSSVTLSYDTSGDYSLVSNPLEGAAASAIVAQTLRSASVNAFIDDLDNAGSDTLGDLTVSATDRANLFSNSLMLTEASAPNDGGVAVITEELSSELSTYTTASTSLPSDYRFDEGDTVYVLGDYTGGGERRQVYEYMGADGTQSNGANPPDFSDADYWRVLTATNVLTQMPGVGDSNTNAVGAILTRNDSNAEVVAKIVGSDFDTDGDVTVSAVAQGEFLSTLEAELLAGGGNGVTGGESTNLAVGGFIASNNLRGSAEAFVRNSAIDVDSGAGFTISALQNRTIEAYNNALISSGEKSAGVSIAFNTVGFNPSGFLEQTIDALIGRTAIMTKSPVNALAFVEDSVIDVEGQLRIEADNTSKILAELTNDVESSAGAMFASSSGFAGGGLLSSNLVVGDAKAYITETTGNNTEINNGESVDGDVIVRATNNARIDANTVMQSVSDSTGGDGGTTLVDSLLETVTGIYDYSSVRGSTALTSGDLVRVAGAHTEGGASEKVYRYTGPDGTVDLSLLNYGLELSVLEKQQSGSAQVVANRIIKIGTGATARYFKNSSGDTQTVNWSSVTASSLGSDSDYTEITASSDAAAFYSLGFERIGYDVLGDLMPEGMNFYSGEATAVSILITRNEVESSVEAFLSGAISVEGDSVIVDAEESATIKSIAVGVAEAASAADIDVGGSGDSS